MNTIYHSRRNREDQEVSVNNYCRPNCSLVEYLPVESLIQIVVNSRAVMTAIKPAAIGSIAVSPASSQCTVFTRDDRTNAG